MLAMARHAWIRTRVMLTSPGDVALLLVAAGSSLLLWPPFSGWELIREANRPFFYVILVLAAVTFWLWSWVAARPLARVVSFAGRASSSGGQPLPALPIGASARAVAEVSALLALLLVFRAATVEVLTRLFLARDVLGNVMPRDRTVISGLAYYMVIRASTTTAPGCLTVLPVFLAWLAPTRHEGTLFGRSFVVATASVLCGPALVLATAWSNVAIALTIGLVPLLLSAYALHEGLQVPFVSGKALLSVRSVRLSRPGLLPEARFRRDRLESLARRFLAWVVPAIALLLGAFFLHERAGLPEIVYLGALPLAAVLLVGFYAAPLGINVFSTDRAAGSVSLLGGAHGRAWSAFPLRPEVIARAVYAHGLMGGLLAWLIWAGLLWTARWGALWLDIPWLLLGVPCAAGLLLCAHAGDYWRGMLSAITVVSLLPIHLLFLVLRNYDMLPGDGMTLPFAVLLALAVVGSLPPLVHLRRRRPTG